MSASFYNPKTALTLRLVFEDYKQGSDARLAKVYKVQCRPKRVEVNINDYTQADTFSCELDYKNFPFDPRALRALGVTVHMEDTNDEIIPSESNAIFQGFADEDTIELDENSRIVKFEGRDFTSLLIDAPYPKQSTIALSTPLDDIISQIISSLPAVQNIRVENRTGEKLPTLGQFAPDFSAMGGQKNVKRDDTYWDVIQDLVSRAALIAYIELDTLVITKPRVLYNSNKAIQFIYGKNLKKLHFKRKLGRQKNFNIRVLSLDLEGKSVVEALIPEQASEEWSKSIGIPRTRIKIPRAEVKSYGKDNVKKGVTTAVSSGSPRSAAKGEEDQDAPFLTFRLPNIKNKAHLINVGEGIFEEVGRQQIEGSMATREMLMVQDDSKKFDLLKLRTGSPVAIEIAQQDMEAIRRAAAMSDRVNYLRSAGYTDEASSGIVSAMALSTGKMPMVFYTKAVRYQLDEQGFELNLDFVNFIEIGNRLLK